MFAILFKLVLSGVFASVCYGLVQSYGISTNQIHPSAGSLTYGGGLFILVLVGTFGWLVSKK